MIMDVPTNPPCQINSDEIPEAIYKKALVVGLAKLIEDGSVRVETRKLITVISTVKEIQPEQSREG